MTLTQESIAEKLKQARKSVRLNQEDVAEWMGFDRTVIVKIEKGTRTVTGVELYRLAKLYRRDPIEFLVDEPLQEDPMTILGRIQGDMSLKWSQQISQSIEILKEAVRLRNFLGDQTYIYPPSYQLPVPTSYEEAVEQGQKIAILERERLKLGSGAITDIANLIASQGIWTAAVPLANDISGLFITHQKYGLAIFINYEHPPVRRRFSYAHEYAHTLMDRNRRTPEPTSTQNRDDLIEKRANAFASEFLIPAMGVYETLERMQKGRPSSTASWIWDVATNEAVHHEVRHGRLPHEISVHDVALLAQQFKVSYEVAAIRLRDINAIRKNQLDRLLAQREKGKQLIKVLKFSEVDFGQGLHPDEQPYLIRQLIILGIEAFRRDKISMGRFRAVCKLAEIPYEDLMPIAMAGIEE